MGALEWLREKADDVQDKLAARLGMADEEEAAQQSLLQQVQEATTLTRTQRFLGFLVCFAMGMLLSLMAPAFVLRPVKLATTLTLGNLLSISSMLFLVGPSRQCASMFEQQRWQSTAIYLASLVATLAAAFWLKSRLICLVCIVIQYLALVWYSLSYIPWAQAGVLRMLGRAPLDEF